MCSLLAAMVTRWLSESSSQFTTCTRGGGRGREGEGREREMEGGRGEREMEGGGREREGVKSYTKRERHTHQ